MKEWKKLLIIFLVFPILFGAGFGDEGLWPFNMVPVKVIKDKYGFEITKDWLKHFQLSCVLVGGSASFVSPNGLVITNHHVGARAIHNLSSADHDYIKNGFYAPALDKELRCPGLEVKILVDIEDVTSIIRDSIKKGMDTAQAGQAMQKEMSRIEKEYSEKTGLQCDVITLYAGALYHLYKYKTYEDVRLVFAPEEAMAKFGGDPDNYGYPRYCLDVAFFRVYKNGRPLKTDDYLKWNISGVKENELVFCAGNPMFTFRLLTYAQMEFLRDVKYPMVLKKYIRQRDFFTEFNKKGPEQERRAGRDLWGALNEVKCFTGMLSGLNDKEIMQQKKNDETYLQNAVNSDPALKEKYGEAWDKIAEAQKAFACFYKPYFFFVEGEGFRSQFIWLAESIEAFSRTADEDAGKRLKARILAQHPIYQDFEIARLTQSLSLLQEELSSHLLVTKILGNRTPSKVAENLVKGSRIEDLSFRKNLVTGNKSNIQSCKDPALQLVRLIAPERKRLQDRYNKEVRSVEVRYGAQISRVLFDLRGTSIAPDATHTLRLSYGVVKSYYENDGSFIPYETNFKGLFERSDRTGNKQPYELAPSFIRARSKIDMNVPYNFAATVDASGGNSGSPLVNKNLEFVGILFDGNRQSLPHRFLYSDKQVRSVMVHALGIMESLKKVYMADALIEELLGADIKHQ